MALGLWRLGERETREALEIVDRRSQARERFARGSDALDLGLDQPDESAKAVDRILQAMGQTGHVLPDPRDDPLIFELALESLEALAELVALGPKRRLTRHTAMGHREAEAAHHGEKRSLEQQQLPAGGETERDSGRG